MTKKMLIDAVHPEEVRVALLDQGKVEDFDFESAARKPLRGNIYLARITRVEPSLQAAFVEYGGNRHGFLAFSEIHPDYYQIPVSDRKLLQEAEAEVAALAAQLELVQRGDEDDDDDLIDDDDDQPDAAADALNEDDFQDDDGTEEEDEEEDVKDGLSKTDAPAEPVDSAPEGDAEARAPVAEAAESDQPHVLSEDNAHDGEENDAQESETLGDKDNSDADDGAQAADESEESAKALDPEESETEQKKPRRKKRDSRAEIFERYKDAKRKRSRLLRNYKIQEVIKRRQILLIQVVKEERGNKGAALTTYMSLAGRYCVLMPNTARGGGISRKIATASDRKRLRRVVDSLEVPQGMGLIIRTAGAKRTKTEIKRDYDYLLRLWENIRTLTLKSIAPCLIYEEASLIKRAIRDLYDKDISKVLVEGEAGYREAKDFMKMLMPSHAKNVQPYKERAPIFLKHNVESQLDGMYLPSVRLKSGGYIVIHQTEALIAIDVNSGRSTRERNIELTALKTNIEAAQEAARQFRLRDLAGLIVLDFIDMEEPKNNRKVEKALKEALKSDRARIQVGRISNFGLLELSRQRRRSGIIDGTTHSCPTCSGAGVVRSHEIAALRILRAIEGEAISGKVGKIIAHTSLDVSLYILNHNRDWLARIEQLNGVKVEILADSEKAGDAFDLEKSGVPQERVSETAYIRPDQMEPAEVAISDDDEQAQTASSGDKEEEEKDEQPDSGRKRKRRRRRRKDTSAAAETTADNETSVAADDQPQEESAEKSASTAEDGEQDEDAPKRRRRRGRRGGRRNRRSGKEETDVKSEEAAANADQPNSDTSAGEIAAESVSEAPQATEETGEKTDPVPAPQANGREDVAEAPEVEPQPNAASAQVETTPETPPKAKKTARKGWWQRAIG
jgi:ribonuclease E